MINKFSGDYAFLSNFYNCSVYYNGLLFKNSEAAFHAQKSLDKLVREEFIHLDGREAKRKGRKVKLRADWESVKTEIMFEVVLAKFMQNKKLKELLLKTGDELIVEGNTWNDRFWGMVDGQGENYLGKILMSVREIVRMTMKSAMEYDIRHNNPVNECEVAPCKVTISEHAARIHSDSEEFPSVTLDLPYGTKLRATAIDDENFPAINIDLLENHNHEERRVCFVEYNLERDKGHEISIGVYQHDEDENVFYESYVPIRYTYSIDINRVMTVFKDGNILCKISHVSESDKEFIFRDTILRMLDIDSDDESNIGKEV